MSDSVCYSVRQLSPFVGMIHIVEDPVCRALSSDGVHWQIQASCETHQHIWKISDEDYTPRRYVLYGSWSAEKGFSHLPLDPMLDVPRPQHVQQQLISQLETQLCKLPFQPLDHYECWIMQDTHTPLALLASATHAHMLPHIQRKKWQAIPQQDYASSQLNEDFKQHIQQLEQAINQHTHTAWFERDNNAQAHALTEGYIDLPPTRFPPLLINPDALSPQNRADYDALINWLSPRLLGLQNLPEENRLQLEQLAQHQAIETHRRLAIYPVPLQTDILNKIRVELKIRGV